MKKSKVAVLCLTIAILGGDVMTSRELGNRALDCVEICERCMPKILEEIPEQVAVEMVQMATAVIERMPPAPVRVLTTTTWHGYGTGHVGGTSRPGDSSGYGVAPSDFRISPVSGLGTVRRKPSHTAPKSSQNSTSNSVVYTANIESVSAVDNEENDDHSEPIDMTTYQLEGEFGRDNEDGWDVDQEPTDYAR